MVGGKGRRGERRFLKYKNISFSRSSTFSWAISFNPGERTFFPVLSRFDRE